MSGSPTPYPEVNRLVEQVLAGAREVLGPRFVGMYLDGSLANGGFDEDSDIDFVVVTTDEVSGDLFTALQAMHDRLSTLDTPWAIQLEGSYVSQQALRRHDPANTMHPNIERGRGERLKMADHDQAWDIHRWVLRERGIVVAGSAPHGLIDPVPPERLRQAMQPALHGWLAGFLDHPAPLRKRGYQSYVVLSICRILYTLETGEVASKPAAAGWAKQHLPARWQPLIERAWVGRHDPDEESEVKEVEETREMIRYAVGGKNLIS